MRRVAALTFLIIFLLPPTLLIHAQDAVPRFEPTEICPVYIPLGILAECGYLIVPEDRSDPNSPEIRLAVLIWHSDNPNPQPDPIVYLAGGPGQAALTDDLTSWLTYPVFQEHDLILIDQRGTGYSQPYLGCTADAPPGDKCRDMLLEQGVNLAAYNSAASADDLEDLRLTLGYDQWNLFGISYGTRLALTNMRDHPDGLRSVVLDSVYPPEVLSWISYPFDFWRSFEWLFQGCAADPDCNAAYPDLKTVLVETVSTLNDTPAEITDPSSGEAISYDGESLVRDLQNLAFSRGALPYLPRMIYEIHNGEFATYDGLMAGSLYKLPYDNKLPYNRFSYPYLFRKFTLEEYQAALMDYMGISDVDGAVEALKALPDVDYYYTVASIYLGLLGEDAVNAALVEPLGLSDASQVPAALEALSDDAYWALIDTYIFHKGLTQALTEQVNPELADSKGMFYSVECNEEMPFNDHDQFLETNAEIPQPVRDILIVETEEDYKRCSTWGAGVSDSIETERVTSDIPTLILAGEYDPVTPPVWAQSAAEGLSNHFYYQFRGVTHTVSYDPCAQEIMRQFWDDPTREPDASCLAGLGEPDFVVGDE